MNVRLRNMATGSTTDRSFSATRRFERVRTKTRQVQFLYSDGAGHHFMDMENFEEIILDAAMLGDGVNYLVPQLMIDLLTEGDDILACQLPATVAAKIESTDPGHRGDTATGVTKPALLETGLTTQVPLFITTGETVVVSTSTGAYIERRRR